MLRLGFRLSRVFRIWFLCWSRVSGWVLFFEVLLNSYTVLVSLLGVHNVEEVQVRGGRRSEN